MTVVAWVWIALSVVGAITFSALVWFAGPIISVGELAAVRRILAALRHHPGRLDHRRRLDLLHNHQAPARRRGARKGVDRACRGRNRRARPCRENAGRAGHPEEEQQIERELSLRSAVVPDHRAARRRQDHGAGQFRAQVSAGQRHGGAGGARGRRHALLRLVVHRRGGADRHGGALHHAGLGRQGRSKELAVVPCDAARQPAAPTDQRRAGGDQHRGHSQALGGGSERAR